MKQALRDAIEEVEMLKMVSGSNLPTSHYTIAMLLLLLPLLLLLLLQN
jgi:hypothetical protein